MVPAAGVEPAAFRSGGERSNPLKEVQKDDSFLGKEQPQTGEQTFLDTKPRCRDEQLDGMLRKSSPLRLVIASSPQQ